MTAVALRAAPPVRNQAGACTAFPLATRAATDVLEEGGNAVDAAVAAAWALSVCEPSASGLGGQTTLLCYTSDGATRVIDGHSHAPRLASVATISHEQQQRGHRSCTIPSTPATLQYAHRVHGRLGWERVLAPAIAVAEEGFAVSALQQKQTGWVKKWLTQDRAACGIFLRGGEAPRAGEVLRQPQLARTLRRIAEHGAADFYQGSLARDIAGDMRAHGGLIDEEDLATFAGPVERPPLRAPYRDMEVITAPPPGGGVQLLLALKLLERLLPEPRGAALEDWYMAVALATYGAFRSREISPVRPEEMSPALLRDLLGEQRIALLATALRHGPALQGPAQEEPGDTTHLTVADDAGNVVALTQSIQSVFGAKVANGKLGFLYNNYLRTCPRQVHPAQLAPRCLSRSNASPALVLREGRPFLALGSAGSRRITSSLLQVTSNVVDREMTLEKAVAAPRVHALLSGTVWVEAGIDHPQLLEHLARRFRKTLVRRSLSFSMGAVHALQFLPGGTIAVADPRRDGSGAVLPEGPRP